MGPISRDTYATNNIQFVDGKNGVESHKRLQIGNLAESIAFKTEKEMKFYNKHHYIPLAVKNDNGKLVKVYVNVNSLAHKTGLTKNQIREENKQGMLEALVNSKAKSTTLEGEKSKQTAAKERHQTKLQELREIDPSLGKRRLDKMVKMLVELENREVPIVDRNRNLKYISYFDHLDGLYHRSNPPKPEIVQKANNDFPYSFEYHGKNRDGDPILLIKYDPNFAKGAFKKSTKALDFYSARVLVKSKIVTFGAVDEVQGYRNMDGVKGALNLVTAMKYKKNGEHREAIYTDFKNIGDLVKQQKGLFGRLKAKVADIPREQQQRVLLLGMYSLLETLEQVHAKGIVHRDIKPQNIFLHHTKSGGYEFFLGDAGFSSRIDRKEDYRRGNPIFAAPEQLQYDGINYPTEKIDIFALGKTFQEIFKELAKQKGNDPDEWNDSNLNRLFSSMQERIVANRYSATQAKEELKGILVRMGVDPQASRP